MAKTPLMPNLADDIKTLVNAGIYSLYDAHSSGNTQYYVLRTDKGARYVLTSDGDFVDQLSPDSLTIGETIRFTSVPNPPARNYRFG